MLQAMCNRDYMGATWICMAAALFNQMSGINIINTYSTKILDTCEENGMKMVIDISTCNYMIGAAGCTGAALAALGQNLTMRAIFIGGHFGMMVFLGGTFAFYVANIQIPMITCIILFIISF